MPKWKVTFRHEYDCEHVVEAATEDEAVTAAESEECTASEKEGLRDERVKFDYAEQLEQLPAAHPLTGRTQGGT